MSDVVVLQHVWCETLGTIAGALEAAGSAPRYVRTFEGQPVPRDMGDAAGLIVMGGPMSVYEQARYPFLRDEMRLIEKALREEKPVLGVCLGSQLLAATLGGRVVKGSRKEIGWFPVRLGPVAQKDALWAGAASPFTAYHWHGDVFSLPRDAVSLASSDMTDHQAFRYGQRAYGFLFHMEVTEEIMQDMVRTFADELLELGVKEQDILRQADSYLPDLHRVGGQVFGRWVGLVKG